MTAEPSIEEQLAALRRSFVSQLPQRLDNILSALSRWESEGDASDLQELHRLVHSLTGAGATFGFQDISIKARLLERVLKELCQNEASPEKSTLAQVNMLLGDVHQSVFEAQNKTGDTKGENPEITPPRSNQVCLLEKDANARNWLKAQLEHYDYKVCPAESLEDLQNSLQHDKPLAIIADTLIDAEDTGLNYLAKLRETEGTNVPTIFLSSRADLDARLAAVKAGGHAYLTKPVKIEHLIDILDDLRHGDDRQPYRILIIDDSALEASHHAMLLQRAGIQTKVVTDVMRTLEMLDEFAPELILMDVHMPICNGMEMAAVIRQLPQWVGVPIVFLSSETEREAQLEAMRLGGDDFLTKPIAESDLIASISIRAERYRTIRTLMWQDSLTGLYNHTKLSETLRNEVERARRYGYPVSFVMLDLDHFKQINDTYGHAAGDNVLKSLSRLLLQRLRNSDTVGRYGGEEFAIIMPQTDAAAATKVMEGICHDFALLPHFSSDQEFYTTLSAGIASTPPHSDPQSLREAADQALYQAKDAGRNRVIGPKK